MICQILLFISQNINRLRQKQQFIEAYLRFGFHDIYSYWKKYNKIFAYAFKTKLYVVLKAIQDIAPMYCKLMCSMAQTIPLDIRYLLWVHSFSPKVVDWDSLHENVWSNHGRINWSNG